MSIRNNYQHTIYACMVAFACQAVVTLFAPLLFLTFHQQFGLSLAQIGWLVTINFCTQLMVDLLCARLASFISYRKAILAAHACCSLGLLLLGLLPGLMVSPYAGLCIATIAYSIGGGLLEVMVSPIAEACPTERKAAYMSLIHSFYCWGCVGTIGLSTLLFHLVGLHHWRWISALWAVVPAMNLVYFSLVPINCLVPDGRQHGFCALLGNRIFWAAMLLMVCAGASEQAIAQWSSAFVESALGLSKKYCDLEGPCLFAICMGMSRVFFARHVNHLNLRRQLAASAAVTLAGYILAALSRLASLGLLGCALCGLGVGAMWPGTLSLAARSIPRGGTTMFALLALGGDIGCATGPTLVGCIATAAHDNLQKAFLAATIFPLLLLLGLANRFEPNHIHHENHEAQ